MTAPTCSKCKQPLPRDIAVEAIAHAVMRYYHVSPHELYSHTRIMHHILPRHVAMYLIRQHTARSLAEIGATFGGRDHSTVLVAVKRIKERMVADERLNAQVKQLTEELEAQMHEPKMGV